MHARIIFAAGAAVVLSACGGDAAPASQPDSPPAVQAASVPDVFVETVTAENRTLFVGRDSTVLPAGTSSRLFVPLSTFSVERDGIPNEFPPAEEMAALLEAAGVGGGPVVIVGEPIAAGRAWTGLDYLGLGDRAALLDGGLAAYPSVAAAAGTPAAGVPAAGMPSPGAAAAQLDIDVRDDMIVDAAWVHDRLADPTVVILDARPSAEYSGETPGAGIDRPGHIPGARNLFWQTLVQSQEDPRLKDEAELRRIFEEAGVGPGDTVVSYCRTGGQASFLYAVARSLGYDVKLYDGSFIDWSRTDYPVER